MTPLPASAATSSSSSWNRGTRPDAPAHGNSPEEELAADRLLAVQVAQRVAATLQQPVTVKGVNHVVSASIGITYATLGPSGPAGTVTAEQVLQDADTAMYLAKGRGRDRFEVFEHGLVVVDRDARVAPRNGRVEDGDVAIGRATDERFPGGEIELLK